MTWRGMAWRGMAWRGAVRCGALSSLAEAWRCHSNCQLSPRVQPRLSGCRSQHGQMVQGEGRLGSHSLFSFSRCLPSLYLSISSWQKHNTICAVVKLAGVAHFTVRYVTSACFNNDLTQYQTEWAKRTRFHDSSHFAFQFSFFSFPLFEQKEHSREDTGAK